MKNRGKNMRPFLNFFGFRTFLDRSFGCFVGRSFDVRVEKNFFHCLVAVFRRVSRGFFRKCKESIFGLKRKNVVSVIEWERAKNG